MNHRLTDEELEALAERFSSGRHPKIAAAIAELKSLRGWPDFHARAVRDLAAIGNRPDLVREAGIRTGDHLADAVPYLVAEIDRLRAGERHRIRESVVPGAVIKARAFVLFSCECGWSVELPVGTKSHTCESCGRTQEAE